MPVDPGGRKRGLNQAPKPPRKRQPPVTPPDQQDRRRAHVPEVTHPDQAARQKQARKKNFRRGAAPTGGPGRRDVRETNRLITRYEKGKANTAEVQRHLRRKGFDLAVDNQWGPQTQEAWKTYLRGVATGQEQHAAEIFHRQRDYLRDFDPERPANASYERQLFGPQGHEELNKLRTNQLQARYANQTNPNAPHPEGVLDKAPVARGLLAAPGVAGDIGKAVGGYAMRQIQPGQQIGPGGRPAAEELKYEDSFASDVADVALGPNVASALAGGDFDNKWLALEAVLLPFRPIATARGAAVGAFALRKGVKAAKTAAKTEYRGPGLAYRGARKFKVGDEEFVKEPSRSAFGRSIDRALDRVRNTNKQAGRTQGYSTKFALDTKNVTVNLLRKATRGLTDAQEYSLRVLAEGVTPEERMAHHLKLAQTAPRQELKLYHLEHAAWNKEAAKYVELNPAWTEGSELPRVILKPAVKGHAGRALRRLEKAWGYFQETGELRQTLLQDIGRLQDDRIMYRLHAPGRVVKGARFKKFEEKIQEELEADPARQQAFEWISREFADDPVQANAARALYDSVIRSTAEETGLPVSQVAARIGQVTSKVELDEIPELGAFYQTVNATEHIPGILPFREMAENVIKSKAKLPAAFRTPAKLTRKIDELYTLVRQGADYKDWYARMAKVLTQTANDLGVEPETFAQVVAVYSQQANPTENLRRAAVAVNQFKQTGEIAGGMPGQAAKAMTVLQGGNWEGRKTNSFYANALKYINPERYAKEFPGSEVTVDRHIAHAFTGEDRPGPYYDGMEKVFQEIADMLGWAPEEVQAAAWVPIKAGRMRANQLGRGKNAMPVEGYMPSAADAYERGYAKYKGELYQREGVDQDIEEGVRATLEDGGYTWNGDMTPFEPKGFGASYEQYNMQVPQEKFNAAAVKYFRSEHDALLQADPDMKVGSWLDPENGNVHLDLTQIFKDKSEAEKFAIRENQQAYFDYEKGEALFPDLDKAGEDFFPKDWEKQERDLEYWYQAYDKASTEALDIVKKYPTGGMIAARAQMYNSLTAAGWKPAEAEALVEKWYKNVYKSDQFQESTDPTERLRRELAEEPEGIQAPEEDDIWSENDEALFGPDVAGMNVDEAEGAMREAIEKGYEVDPNKFDVEANLYEAVSKIGEEVPQLGRKLELIEKSLEVDDFRGVREIARNLTEGLPEEQADMIFPLVRQIMESALALGKAAEEATGGLEGMLRGFADDISSDEAKEIFEELASSGATLEQVRAELRAMQREENFESEWDILQEMERRLELPGEASTRPHEGFQEAAAEELQSYAAMARDVANTIPEEEWPAWVRNQIRAQQEEFPDISRRTTEGEYFQRGGNLQTISPYGIKGAVAFDSEDIARIFLTSAADQTTLAHELAHVMRRLLPEASPHTEQALAKFSGARITNQAARAAARKAGRKPPRPEYAWDEAAEEKFADGLLRTIRTGVAPPHHKKEYAALARSFTDILEDNELPDVPFHVHKALAKMMTGYEKKAGGRIFEEEDVKYGISYAPTWRGVPFRLTSPHRAMGAYIRGAQSRFFGGGRGRAVGGGPDDQALKKSYEGAALISGYFRKDAVGPLAEASILASRMSAAASAHSALKRAGSAIPVNADDIAVKIDPSKQLGEEIKRFWEKTESFGDRKLTGDEFDPVSFELIEEARRTSIPMLPHITAERDEMKRLALKAIETEVPVDNIVWVPKEFMDASGLLYVPQSAKYQDMALRKWMRGAGLTWDVVNDLVKAQILWLNPAYAPAQFLGNMAMNLMHQGPFAAVSGYKSVMMLRKMPLEHRLTVDTWMGEGIGGVIKPRGPLQGMETLHRWNSVASDILPRRMAFMHEARRDGYKTFDQVNDLAKRARAGDEEAIAAAEQIARRARRSIVDFDNLTPFEREVVSRWIFFYPWLRAASDYSVAFVRDHPLQAVTIALMYEHMKGAQQDILGDHPYYSNLDVPIATESVGLKVPWTEADLGLDDFVGKHTLTTEGPDGEPLPNVFKLRQAFTQTTPLEIAQALKAWSLDWDSPESAELINFLTPTPYGMGVALFGYDPYEGKEVPRGPLTFLNQVGITQDENQAIPVVDRVRKLFFESDEHRKDRVKDALYPRTKTHEALRVGLGSLAPTPYNPRVGQERAKEDEDTIEYTTWKLKRDGKAADLPPPSKEALEDLEWNKKLYKGWRSLEPLEKAKRSAEFHDRRFGTNYVETYVPRIKTEAEAQKMWEAINPRLYPRFGQYRSWIRKRNDVQKGLTSVSD